MVVNISGSSYNFNKSEWNINQLFSEILKDLIVEKNKCAQIGDIRGWFNTCRTIYRNIYGYPKVVEKDMKDIDNIMKKIKVRFRDIPENPTQNLTTNQQISDNRIKTLLDEVDLRLMNQLYSSGLIFPQNSKLPP